MSRFERYFDAIGFLEGLSNLPLEDDYMVGRKKAEVYLKRMRYFLNLLGNPDRGRTFIHVTGTAGKGTVTNILHEMLFAAGKNVGSFTSPSVTTPIEKIRVRNAYIAPDELAGIVENLKPYIDKAYREGPYGRPSLFEIFLAAAFVYFKKQRCEWVVLEVGLGGRYDATNVIEKPAVTALTNIDYDHTELLGHTLQKIGQDKAGIIKRGSAFFTSEQRPALTRMFKEICRQKNVSFTQIPRMKSYREYNHALATAIAQSLGIEDRAIRTGIRKACLPCRFECVQSAPAVILDGAHNRSKMRSTVANLSALSYRKLHLVIGIAQGKDHAALMGQIVPYADRVYVTRFQHKERKCAPPKELFADAQRCLKKGTRIELFLDPERALSKALGRAQKNDLVLVTGSFFLAGELRKRWVPEERILRKRKSF